MSILPEYLSMFTFGTYLSRKRDEKGWSQRELARKAGISFMTVSAIESGTTKSPGIAAVIALSKALNVHILDFIFAYEGKDPDLLPTRPEVQKNEDLVEAFQKFLKDTRKES